MKQDIDNPKHWIADEGKVFFCDRCKVIMGTELFLGMHKTETGFEPDVIDNYSEIDAPEPPMDEKNNKEISE